MNERVLPRQVQAYIEAHHEAGIPLPDPRALHHDMRPFEHMPRFPALAPAEHERPLAARAAPVPAMAMNASNTVVLLHEDPPVIRYESLRYS